MVKFEDLDEFSAFDEAVGYASRQTERAILDFGRLFKPSSSVGNFYPPAENNEWTNGLWSGEINIMYELTGNDIFRDKALEHASAFRNRIETMYAINNHDMGFLFSPSCVAAYILYGSEDGRIGAIKAADYLASRFNPVGGYIQATGTIGDRNHVRLIIDTFMNLPLLFWASAETGNPRYREIALRHYDTAIDCVLREDNSTYHTYWFDPDSGEPLYGKTHQGNRDGSAWTRGQAWGIYGSALMYRYTGSDKSLDVFWKTLNYFIDHLPHSVIPYWDFDFSDISGEPLDSSALAIAICGMYEMADLSKDAELRLKADKLLNRLYLRCAVKDPTISNGQLLHGVYAKKTPTNGAPCNRGVDECNAWGDYFYVEALMRSHAPGWKAYW